MSSAGASIATTVLAVAHSSGPSHRRRETSTVSRCHIGDAHLIPVQVPKQVRSGVVQRHEAGVENDPRFSAPNMIGRLKLFSCPSTFPAIFV
jgi:hypothetical protein